jgi:hypothetical protein
MPLPTLARLNPGVFVTPEQQVQQLQAKVAALKQQVAALSQQVYQLRHPPPHPSTAAINVRGFLANPGAWNDWLVVLSSPFRINR